MEVAGATEIRIRGARVHNLKNIQLTLPRNQLIAITGLSGSGKSSLAFDTLYAEGQRRYVESLSAYARQFLEQMSKPDVDTIEGLSPAISIEQRGLSHNPRSTVGTVTEIYDYLRLLFARVGEPYCPSCGQPISSQTVQEIVDRVLDFPMHSRFSILAPVLRGRKGEHKKLLLELRRQGFSRVNIDGQLFDLEEDLVLDPKKNHSIDVYVDRLVLKPGIRQRVTDSVELGLKLAEGLVKIAPVDGEDIVLSERHACIQCGISLPEISPRLFSFNSPHGACPDCDGLGSIRTIDPALVVPEPDLPLALGAIAPWGKRVDSYGQQMLHSLSKHYHFDIQTSFKNLSNRIQQLILYGTGEEEIDFCLEREGMSHKFRRVFEGVIPNLERRYRETNSDAVRSDLVNLMTFKTCQLCQGKRLRKEALSILLMGKSIADLTHLSVTDALGFIGTLKLDPKRAMVAERVLKEVGSRLKFMIDVGLNYLTLDRAASTLSGGEGQRIRLATQIGSSLVGVLYILDEPTVGLHSKDCGRLLGTLRDLRNRGNTVIVVEHDPATILAADFVVDMGPGAGRHGGEIVALGTPQEILSHPTSLTGAYLSGRKSIPTPKRRRKWDKSIWVRGAKGNNLKNIDVEFPLGVFTCVTGVSGSGKSTLVIDTLYRGLSQQLYGSRELPADTRAIENLQQINKVIHIDQSPIGRTPRSNPATYTGIFTAIRELFSRLPESKVRGYGPSRYSFNVKGGRCEACQGDGEIRIEMHFLPDVYVTCEVCNGRRFNRETLEVEYRGKSIAQVLEMTISEAIEFFQSQPVIQRKLQTLLDVGLGYVQLGQSATTLSGGEAQRVKLSRELSKRATGRTFYILDEPTTGLHLDDIRQLVEVLDRLVEQGNTVTVIEHNLDVIKQADLVIDLGPGGGEEGGRVVATGTPEELTKCKYSFTGQYLKPVLPPARRRRAAPRLRA